MRDATPSGRDADRPSARHGRRDAGVLRAAVLLGSVIATGAGCDVFVTRERHLYRVVDAASLEPVAGAGVSLREDRGVLVDPHIVRGHTDAQGYVALRPNALAGTPVAFAAGHRAFPQEPLTQDDPLYPDVAGPRASEEGGVIVLFAWPPDEPAAGATTRPTTP